MSRHSVQPLNPDHTVIVGWDDPLETFFAQVWDNSIELSEDDEEDKQLVFMVGYVGKEVPTIEKLQEVLQPFAHITDEINQQLQRDYKNRSEPSPLQQHIRRIFEV